MSRIDRRTVLRTVGGGLGASFGGCLTDGAGDVPTDGDPGTDPGSPTGSDTPTETPRIGDGLAYEVRQFAVATSVPAWYRDEEGPGTVEYYGTAASATAGLDFDAVSGDRRADLEAFVERTDFARSRLLFVETVGPDTCHSRVAVDGLSASATALTASARAVDTREPDEGCGDALTFPSALARLRFDDAPPDDARVTVTDGWERAAELVASAEASRLDQSSLDGHVRPTGDPPAVPDELVCGDRSFRRHGDGFSGRPPWGETDGDGWGDFALRVDRLSVDRGERVTITLANLGPDEAATGNRNKYNLQVRTAAGWQDVRGTSDGRAVGYTDEAVVHDRGEGFRWEFEMTREGVLSGHLHDAAFEVCPGLPAGRYRFVFWEPTVAVAFDLRA